MKLNRIKAVLTEKGISQTWLAKQIDKSRGWDLCGLNNRCGGIQMKLRPMADNVLLKQHEAAETTVSGIVLATTNKEKPAIYEVVSVGPGTKDVEMTIKAGERVVVGKFVGTDVTIDKVDYKFVKQDDILAVVTD